MKYVFIFIFLMLALNVSAMYNKNFTYDESGHYNFGKRLLKGDIKLSMQKMPISALNAIPVYFIEKFNIGFSENTNRLLCRLPTVFFSIMLGVFVFVWSYNLYGLKSGMFSLGLYTFCPNILAHSKLVTNDVYCAALIFISLYFFLKFLNAPSLTNLFISSIVTGFAQLSKNTALLLFFIIPIYFLIHNYASIKIGGEYNLKFKFKKTRFFFRCSLYLLVVILVINAGYLFKGTFMPLKEYKFKSEIFNSMKLSFPDLQIPLPRVFIETTDIGSYYNDTGGGHGQIYLLGKFSEFGWWYYFIIVLLLKLPLALILMIIINTTLVVKKIKYFNDELYLLIPVVIIFVFFSFLSTAQLGIRYILPILPFIYVSLGKITHLVDRT